MFLKGMYVESFLIDVPSAEVQNGVPLENGVMTHDSQSLKTNESIRCVRRAKVPTVVPSIEDVTPDIRYLESKIRE